MKKVLCLACGLMNLEKFVTFPNCAGCGARLSQTTKPSLYERWKRPLRVPFWATFVCLCCLGMTLWGIAIARETGRMQQSQLVAYVLMPRDVRFGKTATLQLTLDSTGPNSDSIRQFYEVRVRLSLSSKEDFDFVSVEPQAQISQLGSGTYLLFDSIARDEPIRVELRPKRVGKNQLKMGIFVRDFTRFDYQSTITTMGVPPRTRARLPGTKQRNSG